MMLQTNIQLVALFQLLQPNIFTHGYFSPSTLELILFLAPYVCFTILAGHICFYSFSFFSKKTKGFEQKTHSLFLISINTLNMALTVDRKEKKKLLRILTGSCVVVPWAEITSVPLYCRRR